MSTINFYKIIEEVEEDEFYDIAHIRVGYKGDEGIVLHLPVPKSLNTDQLDQIFTDELFQLIIYILDKGIWQENQEND